MNREAAARLGVQGAVGHDGVVSQRERLALRALLCCRRAYGQLADASLSQREHQGPETWGADAVVIGD